MKFLPEKRFKIVLDFSFVLWYNECNETKQEEPIMKYTLTGCGFKLTFSSIQFFRKSAGTSLGRALKLCLRKKKIQKIVDNDYMI